ncbi:MAG: hypothetical protein ACI9BK_000558 [Acidimicrobiales bacterium]
MLRLIGLLQDRWTGAVPEANEPRRYDLYGCGPDSLDEIGQLIESGLGRVLKEHDSSYMGGTYLRAAGPPEETQVVPHEPDDEGYYHEDDVTEWLFMVQASVSHRWPEPEELREAMPSLVHLRTQVIEG